MPSRKEKLKKAYDKLEDVTIELTAIFNSIDDSEIDIPGGIDYRDWRAFEKMVDSLNRNLDSLFYYANEWKGGEM